MEGKDFKETLDTSLSVWQGKRVRLRAVEPEDWTVYFAWNQDDEQARALDSVPLPRSAADMRRWMEERAARPPSEESDDFRFAIENEIGRMVGGLSIHHTNRQAGTLSYGINILRGDRRCGYAAEAIALALRYYFAEQRYQKVTVGVFDFNTASIRLHERLGFQLEGRLRRMTYSHGRFFDLFVYGLTSEEFFASPVFADILPESGDGTQQGG